MILKILVWALILIDVSGAKNSTNSDGPNTTTCCLETGKPGVFISFARSAVMEIDGGVEEEAIWLKIHNNMRSGIFLLTFPRVGSTGVFYEVVPDALTFIPHGPRVPESLKEDSFYSPGGDAVRLKPIKPGSAESFYIPRRHLRPGLSIRVPFHYSWEELKDIAIHEGPQHFVIFGNYSLPESVQEQK